MKSKYSTIYAIVLIIAVSSCDNWKIRCPFQKKGGTWEELDKEWQKPYKITKKQDALNSRSDPTQLKNNTVWLDSLKLRFYRGDRKYYELTEREYVMAESLTSGYFASHKGKTDYNGHVINSIEQYFIQYCAYEENMQKAIMLCLYPYEEMTYIHKPYQMTYIQTKYNDSNIMTPKGFTDYLLLKIDLTNRTVKEVYKEDMR